MAIARKPLRNTTAIPTTQGEQAADAFIAKTDSKRPEKARPANKTPIMIRFDPVLLDKVDTTAQRRGISRSAWIQYVISRAIDSGEG